MARIQEVGDRCFQESIFEAARILFQSINNYACLASCFVKLNRLREAVTAATKANTPKSWKEVLYACVDALDFKNAQVCALNLIMDSDELDHITTYYESRGHFEQLIKLLEKGLQQENPNMGICTSLGIAYCKYQPEKLMDHITKYYKRISINRLLSHCSTNELYPEMRFLYSVSDEHDNAIKLMIEHPAECYDANAFGDSITKVLSTELCYRAIQFYVEFYPSKLNDLLGTISQKVDHERIAQDAKADGSLPLFKKHFQNIQELNLAKVNDALNQLYVDEEDYDKLRESIKHDNFNQLALAKQLESHPLLEFRRISAHLFRVNKNFAASIDISKKDNLYRDAIDTAALSKDSKIAEDLLRFFISKQKKECFAACLFTCYEIIRPDVGLELAWRFGYQDMAMPFLIQVLREYTTKVNELYADKQKADELRKQLERQPGSELVVDQGSFMGSDVAGMIPGMIPGNMSGFIPGVGVGGFSQGMMDPSMFNNGVVQQYGNHF
jgi:clathrin heavy chain